MRDEPRAPGKALHQQIEGNHAYRDEPPQPAPRYRCGLCGRVYDDRGDRLGCCSDRFDESDQGGESDVTPDYLTAADVDQDIIAQVAENVGATTGDVTAELWGHPDNDVRTPAERAAVEARRRQRNRNSEGER